jgi:hypothetical protein
LETMCVEKGRCQRHRIDTGINITIFVIEYSGGNAHWLGLVQKLRAPDS